MQGSDSPPLYCPAHGLERMGPAAAVSRKVSEYFRGLLAESVVVVFSSMTLPSGKPDALQREKSRAGAPRFVREAPSAPSRLFVAGYNEPRNR